MKGKKLLVLVVAGVGVLVFVLGILLSSFLVDQPDGDNGRGDARATAPRVDTQEWFPRVPGSVWVYAEPLSPELPPGHQRALVHVLALVRMRDLGKFAAQVVKERAHLTLPELSRRFQRPGEGDQSSQDELVLVNLVSIGSLWYVGDRGKPVLARLLEGQLGSVDRVPERSYEMYAMRLAASEGADSLTVLAVPAEQLEAINRDITPHRVVSEERLPLPSAGEAPISVFLSEERLEVDGYAFPVSGVWKYTQKSWWYALTRGIGIIGELHSREGYEDATKWPKSYAGSPFPDKVLNHRLVYYRIPARETVEFIDESWLRKEDGALVLVDQIGRWD